MTWDKERRTNVTDSRHLDPLQKVHCYLIG